MVGLVINKEYVVRGNVIKSVMHKYSFLVNELLGLKFQVHLFFCSLDREGSGRLKIPALR